MMGISAVFGIVFLIIVILIAFKAFSNFERAVNLDEEIEARGSDVEVASALHKATERETNSMVKDVKQYEEEYHKKFYQNLNQLAEKAGANATILVQAPPANVPDALIAKSHITSATRQATITPISRYHDAIRNAEVFKRSPFSSSLGQIRDEKGYLDSRKKLQDGNVIEIKTIGKKEGSEENKDTENSDKDAS